MTTESKFRQLLRKRITLKRRPSAEDGTPRDIGFSMIQLVVAMVIVGVLTAIAGPPLWDQVFGARERALKSNVQSAAEVIQTTLTSSPDLVDGLDATTGAPATAASEAFTAGLPVNWLSDQWDFKGTDSQDDMRVQFILKNATVDAPVDQATGTEAPEVPWLARSGGAVRVHARNSDGAWACALVVLQPSIPAAGNGFTPATARPTTAVSTTTTPVTASAGTANIRGVWYDSGTAVGSDDGLNNCSPVAVAAAIAGSDEAPLPVSATEWQVPQGSAVGILSDDAYLTRSIN